MKRSAGYILVSVVFLGLALVWALSHGMKQAPESDHDLVRYRSYQYDFSLDYPKGYEADEDYRYGGMGPGREIPGVAFKLPAHWSEGTNLSSDSYISVESRPAEDCQAADFLLRPYSDSAMSDAGVQYSRAHSEEGAAGNLYQEYVWAVFDSSPCVAVRYVIHTTNIQNYPEGAVRQFDREGLIAELDGIRRSLILDK